jgi:hypothetical protein
MESYGPWKFVKVGFWVGIGFIIPSIGVYILGTYLIYSMPSLWQSAGMEGSKETMEKMMADTDKTSQVRIASYREVKNGKQLLILGTVENTGESQAGSIRIEAELLDGNKQMVFECSEYISKKLKKGEEENFQVKCGCGDQAVPEHKSVSVRVVQASSY